MIKLALTFAMVEENLIARPAKLQDKPFPRPFHPPVYNSAETIYEIHSVNYIERVALLRLGLSVASHVLLVLWNHSREPSFHVCFGFFVSGRKSKGSYRAKTLVQGRARTRANRR